MCLFIAIFQMFTIWQMSHEGVNNMLSFINTNISNVHCFAYIFPCRGRKYVHFYTAIFQMFIVSHISRVGENNMCTFMSICQIFTFSDKFTCWVINRCTFIQQYFKCLLFRIYPRVGQNNMCTFISICQMFTISHIFPCRGKQYVHF